MKQQVIALLLVSIVGAAYNFVSPSTVVQAQERLTLLEAVQQGKVQAEVSGSDNPSREELDSTYQSSFSPFGPGSPAASDADIEEARRLLKEAGIDTTQKRLFR